MEQEKSEREEEEVAWFEIDMEIKKNKINDDVA
jgi:hypothetical protein